MTGSRDDAARVRRTVLFTIALAVVLVCFWSVGGIGFAGTSASSNQYQYGEYGGKVTMCYKRRTIRVRAKDVPQYLARGATLGPCPR